ncbi:unnamed protein product [Urochloa humidicola]
MASKFAALGDGNALAKEADGSRSTISRGTGCFRYARPAQPPHQPPRAPPASPRSPLLASAAPRRPSTAPPESVPCVTPVVDVRRRGRDAPPLLWRRGGRAAAWTADPPQSICRRRRLIRAREERIREGEGRSSPDRRYFAASSSFRSGRGRQVSRRRRAEKESAAASNSAVAPALPRDRPDHTPFRRRESILEKGTVAGRGQKRRREASAATSEESSTARSAWRPAQLRMDPRQCNDGSQGGYPGGNNGPYHPAWNQDASQGGYPGGNNLAYQGAWNPLCGYQGRPSYFPPGFQQAINNFPMMHPSHNGQQVFHPTESSGAYVEDDDLREVPPSEVAKGKGKKKKLSNFKPEEDVIVVKTWLEISCDPITSTGQKRDRLWERIHERYNFEKAESNPERSLRSLQSRWEVIRAEASKFAGYYADVIRENPSGMSDADKTTAAASDYAAVVGHSFPYLHCWNLMKDEPKWREPKGKAGKSCGGDGLPDAPINLGDDDSVPNNEDGYRPMGRDQAKAAKKKANSCAGSTSSSEYAAKMQDLSLQKMSMMQEESDRKSLRFQQLASIDEKRLEEVRCHNQSLLECEQEKIRIMREQQVMERKMAARRRRKEVNEEDERILAVDLNACTPAQRVYFKDRQQQILDKIEARRRKRQQADP